MKKKLWGGGAALILLVLAMAIAGCKHSSGSKTYSVTWAIEGIAEVDDEAGEAAVTVTDVFLNTDTGLPFKTDKNGVTKGFKPLSDVSFFVEAPDGYVIQSVSCSPVKGAGEPETLYDEDGEYKWAITENVTITATFAEPSGVKYTIDWLLNGAGAATAQDVFAAEGGGALPAENIAPGTQIKFTVTEPSDDYILLSVMAGNSALPAVGGVYTVTVNSNMAIRANFRFEDPNAAYTVTWRVTGAGDAAAGDVFALVDGEELPTTDVKTRTTLKFTVTRPDGVADNWALRVSAGATALDADEDGAYSHYVTGNVTITAAFTPMFAITWAVDQGLFEPEGVFTMVPPGSLPGEVVSGIIRFRINPQPANTLRKVEANGAELAPSGGMYQPLIQDDVTITAYFADGLDRDVYWSVTGAGAGAGAVATVANTFTDVTSRGQTGDQRPEGTEANPLNGTTSAYDGTEISFKVAVPGGYVLTGVSSGTTPAAITAPIPAEGGVYTYTVGAANYIRAAFRQIGKFTLEIDSEGGGYDGDGDYDEGAAVSIDAGTPSRKGTEFKYWESATAGVNVAELLDDYQSAQTSFTMPSFTNPATVLRLTAVFDWIDYALTSKIDSGAYPAGAPDNDEDIVTGFIFTVDGAADAKTARYGQDVTVKVSFKPAAAAPDVTPYYVDLIMFESDDPDFQTDIEDDDGYTFKMPDGNLTVTLEKIGMMPPGMADAEKVVAYIDYDFKGLPDEFTLSKNENGNPKQLDIELVSDSVINKIEWSVNGAPFAADGGGAGYTLDAEDFGVVAGFYHTLSVKVTLEDGNGNPAEYSKTVHFMVTR